jgi:hypothetical protein
MFEAASVAALVHLECDRADVGLEALMMADFAGQGLGVTSQRQLIMNAATEPDEHGPWHLTALVLARQFVGRIWHQELPDSPDTLTRTSLAEALDGSGRDVDGVLRATLTEPPLECKTLIPRMRTEPQIAPPLAEQLARIALETIEDRPIPAARIGLEAHYLFAVASREQVPAMRYRLAEFGATWGRLLLALSRFMTGRHDDALALDLAQWGVGLAQQLPPLAGETATVVRDLHARYGDLAAAAGDTAAAESARAAAAAAAQFITD